jgi:hypothetical protein
MCWPGAAEQHNPLPSSLLNTHFPPHTHTTHLKLSSMRRMSAASLAMAVPLFMANPTSAADSAGASLVPSPVMATVSGSRPCSRSALTEVMSRNLSAGLQRAITASRGHSARKASRSTPPGDPGDVVPLVPGDRVTSSRNTGPSRTKGPDPEAATRSRVQGAPPLLLALTVTTSGAAAVPT